MITAVNSPCNTLLLSPFMVAEIPEVHAPAIFIVCVPADSATACEKTPKK